MLHCQATKGLLHLKTQVWHIWATPVPLEPEFHGQTIKPAWQPPYELSKARTTLELPDSSVHTVASHWTGTFCIGGKKGTFLLEHQTGMTKGQEGISERVLSTVEGTDSRTKLIDIPSPSPCWGLTPCVGLKMLLEAMARVRFCSSYRAEPILIAQHQPHHSQPSEHALHWCEAWQAGEVSHQRRD